MTATPMKLVVDCVTGEQQLIPFTPEEIAEAEASYAKLQEEEAERYAAEAAKAAAKASAENKLASLGLTADEIAALLN